MWLMLAHRYFFSFSRDILLQQHSTACNALEGHHNELVFTEVKFEVVYHTMTMDGFILTDIFIKYFY